MAYYRGDYYRGRGRGDYYRGRAAGDPGFLDILKGIGRAALGAVPVVGPALSAITSITPGAGTTTSKALITMPQQPAFGLPAPTRMPLPPFPMTMPLPSRRVQPMPSHTTMVELPDGSFGVRRRSKRMNVLNPKALRRSMRRVQGFASFAKKTISFTKAVRMKKRGGKR